LRTCRGTQKTRAWDGLCSSNIPAAKTVQTSGTSSGVLNASTLQQHQQCKPGERIAMAASVPKLLLLTLLCCYHSLTSPVQVLDTDSMKHKAVCSEPKVAVLIMHVHVFFNSINTHIHTRIIIYSYEYMYTYLTL
jgi:hypothetical protein